MQYPISKDLVLLENALYLPEHKALVISDLQLGYEQQLRAAGHNILYEQAKQMLTLLEVLIKQTDATTMVINGDLKHEFGRISAQERRDIMTLITRLKHRIHIVVVRGNHDTLTKPLVEELGVEFVDVLQLGNTLILHGHKLPEQSLANIRRIIIGHAHPAITLHDGVRAERYKCFLIGTYKRKELVVLPSFSTIVEGTNILTKSKFSPFLNDIEGANIYVLADEIRSFGNVRALRKKLAEFE